MCTVFANEQTLVLT